MFDLDITNEGYKEILKRHNLTEQELNKILERHNCCDSCLSDKDYDDENGTSYGDIYPYCCCKLADELRVRW